MRKQTGWARLLAGMLLILSLAACSDDKKGQRQREAPRVRVEQVVREDAGRVLQVVGNVKASASVGVVSRVTVTGVVVMMSAAVFMDSSSVEGS